MVIDWLNAPAASDRVDVAGAPLNAISTLTSGGHPSPATVTVSPCVTPLWVAGLVIGGPPPSWPAQPPPADTAVAADTTSTDPAAAAASTRNVRPRMDTTSCRFQRSAVDPLCPSTARHLGRPKGCRRSHLSASAYRRARRARWAAGDPK